MNLTNSNMVQFRESKFVSLFRTLGDREIKEFESYLSNFYSRKKSFSKLVTLLSEITKGDPSSKSYFILYRNLFPNDQEIRSKKLSNLFSELFPIINNFLLHQKVHKTSNVYEKNIMLLNIYKERKLDDLFFNNVHKQKEFLEPKESLENWHKIVNLYQREYDHELTSKYSEHANDLTVESVHKLDLYYVTAKLKLSCELVNRINIVNDKELNEDSRFLLNEVISLVADRKYRNYLLPNMYLLSFKLISEKEAEYFNELLQLLLENQERIAHSDSKIFLSYLINFSSIQIKKGNLDFLEKTFELFQIGLDKNLLIDNHYIGSMKFLNIVEVGCKLKKFEWVDHFVDKYDVSLHKNHKEDIMNMTQAIIQIEKGHFEDSIQILYKVTNTDTFLIFRAKILMLVAFYEVGKPLETIDLYCRSLRSYLRRNIKSEFTLMGALNLIRFVKKLTKIRFGQEVSSIELMEELEQTNYIIYKVWLKSKINENIK